MIHILNPEIAADIATADLITLSTTVRNGHVAYAWQALLDTLEDDPMRLLNLLLLYAGVTDVDALSSNALAWTTQIKEAA